jgi:exodeoxyribonuclease VII large subunit
MTANCLSVYQLNTYIKRVFEQDYILKSVTVEGELSNFKKHSSGHIYFTLKDDKSQVSCVLFKGYLTGEEHKLHDGAKVVIKGSVSLFEKTGQYQIYVYKIEKAGIGELYLMFEKLKQSLQKEGLFDESRKKSIPRYAEKIGIVTSSTGAAIQDLVEIARRRNPYVELVLFPSLVQGSTAKYDLVKGIEYFNVHEKVDVIIIGRGGGSIEDLWPFNEELVARAIAASEIPVISAVGHETDFTISDFVADLRASTPSAASELAVFDYEEWMRQLEQLRRRFDSFGKQTLRYKREQLATVSKQLKQLHPKRRLEDRRLYLDQLGEQLHVKSAYLIEAKRHRLGRLQEKLMGKYPLKPLENGYALVTVNGKKITSVHQINKNEAMKVFVLDGTIHSIVEDIEVQS